MSDLRSIVALVLAAKELIDNSYRTSAGDSYAVRAVDMGALEDALAFVLPGANR